MQLLVPLKTLLFLLLAPLLAFGVDINITLAWDANKERDLDHYVLSIGTAVGTWPYVTSVKGLTKTIALQKDVMYVAILTAVNTSQLESPPSEVLWFQVFAPGEGKVPSAPTGLSKPAGLQASIEISKDLIVWQQLGDKHNLPQDWSQGSVRAVISRNTLK